MEEYQLLLVLANKSLYSFPLEALDSNDTMLKRPKKIQGHANFFKAGVCMGRHLVCAAKMSGISTTIKVYEPTDTNIRSKKKPAIGRMFQGTGESLRAFKVGISSLGVTAVNANPEDAGVLRSRRINVNRLPTIQAMCRVQSRLRGRQLGDFGDAATAG